MSLFTMMAPWLANVGPDERVQLQCDYSMLHDALQRTEEACHEVEEAIHQLEEDNDKLLQMIQSKHAKDM